MATAASLSDKDQELFKKAERLFTKKSHKQALKFCDQILRKNEKHGETLALKGAILGRLAENDEQKQEAIDLCKRGVQLDLASRPAWSHLARLYRNNQKYEDSIKSFKMALRLCKPVNQLEKNEIRRDLTFLLAQTRNWQELADMRRQLQLDNREHIVHWIGYCVALFLAKDFKLALSVFQDFRKSPPAAFAEKELAEMNIFYARILEESGDVQGALNSLKELKAISNVLAREEMCAKFELELGLFEEAQSRFLQLIKDRNTENYDYHRGLQSSLCKEAKLFTRGGTSLPVNTQSDPELIGKLMDIYNDLNQIFPKSMACQRIPLDFCNDQEFTTRADKFVRNNLRRGVPCLFTVLKALYRSRNLVASKTFSSIVSIRLGELESNNDEDSKREKGFALYFLAQHLDQVDPGCDQALTTIEKAIVIDPSNPDFLRFKGRVLKHAGNALGAYEAVDSARQLELFDRYLNNKAAKYALRANKYDAALALTHLFTRGEDVHSLPDPAILHDLQCMWFELESAACFARIGDVVTALKNYHWVELHFDQIRDDEFDFHEYCIRRFVINSYVNLIRMEDQVRNAPAFKRCVKGAVESWLRVFDADEGLAALKQHEKVELAAKKVADKEVDESQFAGMTPSEKKRAQKKIKQDKLEKEKVEMAKKLEEAKKLVGGATSSATPKDEEEDDGGDDAAAPAEEKQADTLAGMSNQKPHRRRDIAPDPDPKGYKRFAALCKDPLKPASQLVELALAANPGNPDFLLLSFDVAIRQKDIPKAWKQLSAAGSQVGWFSPELVERFVPFARFAALSAIPAGHAWGKGGKDGSKFAVDEETRKALDAVLASLSKPPVETAVTNLTSLDPAVVVASADALLTANVSTEAAISALSQVFKPLKLAVKAQALLRRKETAAADKHKAEAKKVWPRASAFE